MIGEGVKVILLDSIDADQRCRRRAARPQAAGVKVIDYDRVNLGGTRAVLRLVRQRGGRQAAGARPWWTASTPAARPTRRSSDGRRQGRRQQRGAVRQGRPRGARPAAEQRQAQHRVGDRRQGLGQSPTRPPTSPRRSPPTGGKVDGVARRQRRHRQRGHRRPQEQGSPATSPVTGQDAGVAGLQNILKGDQSMTIFKNVKKEANAAVALAIALITGKTRPRPADADTVRRPEDAEPQDQALLLTAAGHHAEQRQGRGQRRRADRGADLQGHRDRVHRPRASVIAGVRPRSWPGGSPVRPAVHASPQPQHHTGRGAPMADPILEITGPQQELRAGPRAARHRLRGLPGRGHRPRGRQRRRQVDARQVHRRHQQHRQRRGLLRGPAGHDRRPPRRRRARHRVRLPGPRAGRQPRHHPEHVPRPRDPPLRASCTTARWSARPARR